MTNKIIQGQKELENLLPHKGKIILIDKVLDYDLEQGELTAGVTISPRIMFFDEKTNAVPITVAIEFMAQTIGLLSGLYHKNSNEKPKLGFVIGSRNIELFAPAFKNTQYLEIKIKQLFFDSELGAFDCKITNNNELLVSAQLNVFKPAALDEFINN